MNDDQALHELRLAVLGALAASEQPKTQLWLAYDPLLGHTLPLDQGVARQIPLVLPAHLSVETDLAPRLVALAPDPHDRLLEASIAKAREESVSPLSGQRSVCGWAWLTVIDAARLAGASMCRQSDGERWARWHDPRVMHQWMALHTTPAGGPLAQALQDRTWVFLDLQGQARKLSLGPAPADPTVAPGWLQGDIALLARSAQALELVQFWQEHGQPFHQRLLADCHDALLRAQRLALTSDEDRICFAQQWLLEPQLMQTPAVQSAIESCMADPGSLSFQLPAALAQARAKLPGLAARSQPL